MRGIKPVDIEKTLSMIDQDASAILREIEADPKYLNADIKRWAMRHLRYCTAVLGKPTPLSLITLLERMVAVPAAPRSRIKNLKLWDAANEYLFEHPGSTAAQVARAIGHPDKKNVIKAWMDQRTMENGEG